VTLVDPFYPLLGATNEPGTIRPGGPQLWLGVSKPRGIALAAQYASGWPMFGNRPGDVAWFSEIRRRILAALDAAGRDPATFTFAAQLSVGATPATRRAALVTARAFVKAGAKPHHPRPARLGRPDGVGALADEVAEPLLDD